MTQRVLLALALLLAVSSGANGLYMVTNPIGWYNAVPGVIDTGPPNTHFITDIGCAYLASMVLLLAAVLRPRSRGVLTIASAVWPAMHAMVHVVGHVTDGEFAFPASELFGIYVPVVAQLALGIHFAQSDPHAASAPHDPDSVG